MIEIDWNGKHLEFPDHKVPEWAEDYVKETYLLRDDEGKPCEELDEAFVRILEAVGGDGRLDAETQSALALLMQAGVFYPNVVFLMNAGTSVGNYGACYSLKLEDSIEGSEYSIQSTLSKAMSILIAGGGLGIDFTPLRAKGSLISSNRGRASGPVHFMKVFDTLTGVIAAGGRRRGGLIGVLDVHHPDVEEFIDCKEDGESFQDSNLSVRVSSKFMRNLQGGVKEDQQLFRRICEQAWKTGDPGLLFDEALNKDNPCPQYGRVTCTNLCGEVVAPSPFACNLASIDISKFVGSNGGVRWYDFETVVRLGCRFLAAALDCGCYIGEEIQARMKEVRLVGLGLMGFADALLKAGVRYGDSHSLKWIESAMSRMLEAATKELPTCGTRLSLAPTGTLAALAGCSSGIEPNFDWTYERTIRTTGKKVSVRHALVEGYEGQELPDYFVTAHDVTPEEHVLVAAAFQQFADGGVSKTVNLRHDATVEDVERVFMLAWEFGCKGITVFRDGCRREQMLSTTSPGVVSEKAPPEASRRKLPDTCPSTRHRFVVGEQEGYLQVGMFESGELGEVFVTMAKSGSPVRGWVDCFAILTSLCIQYGVPLRDLYEKFKSTRFEPNGMTESKEIPFATSPADYIVRWLWNEFGDDIPRDERVEEVYLTGDVCPRCGSQLLHAGGCKYCPCGYSTCG